MKINQIRPENLSSLANDAYLHDVQFYISRKDQFVERFCPACGFESRSVFFEKDLFKYSRCQACHCIYMNPAPTQELVDQLYKQSQNYKFWSEYIYPKSREERLQTIHKDRAEWVLNYLYEKFPSQKSFTILELGAGTGDTLATLKKSSELDLNLYATEPNPSMSTHLDSNGVSLINSSDLSSEIYRQKFDAVMCFEVLEHLLCPTDVLMKISSNLKPSGLFFASTPNSQSLEVQILKEQSTTIDIEHISVLSPSSVHAMASKTNYKVLDIATPGQLDLELIENGQVVFSMLIENGIMRNQEIQEFLQFSGFSSHMKLILVKDK